MTMALHTATCNVCGDVDLQEDEQCDDGTANSNEPGAACCFTNCRLPFCGDGVVGPGEACDLAGLNSDADGSDCSTTCTAALKIATRDPVTKSAAIEQCQAIGMTVVKVDSAEKSAAVQALIVGTGHDAWLSGSNSGHFDDGEDMPFFKWAPSEPNGGEREGCIHQYDTNGNWNDISCGNDGCCIAVCE
jgi:hypothetical protein